MSDAPAYLFDRRSSRAYIRERARSLVYWFRQSGSLYGGVDADAAEAREIRDECEALGLPMGYGRVGRAPTQIHGYEGPRSRIGPTPPYGYDSFELFELLERIAGSSWR